MEHSERKDARKAIPAPGLLILTGASHTGKTTVARAILDIAPPPAAFLSVDSVLGDTIAHPPESIWEEIPLAYELLAPQVEALLAAGWFVVVESTFTYVPDEGAPEFHVERIEQLIAIAGAAGAPWLLVQLVAEDGVTEARASSTGRLAPDIVDRTTELHGKASMPASTLRLDAAAAPPDRLAQQILAALRDASASA